MKDRKPSRAAMETTVSVLEWLAGGKQDPDMADDINTTRILVEQLLVVGW